MKTPPSASLFDLDFFGPLPIHIEASDAPLTSDAGLLPLRQFDERIGLTKQFAAALDDPRDRELTEHTFLEMVRSRVFGILAGYEDQNDHDALRTDPVFKLIADRLPEDDDLASQPTLSRFENQINIASLKRLRSVLVDQFIASFAEPPLSLTFNVNAVDDPTHGAQQLTLFHAFYEQYQYLPLVVTSAETAQVVMVSLRHGTAAASLGADDDLEYLVTRVRAAWPNVRIRVRGDGGFGNPTMYEVGEPPGAHVHLRPIDQRRPPASRRGIAGRSGAALGRDARAATAVRGVLVSGRFLAGVPLRGGEGGGERPGDEPPLRGDESRGGVAVSGSDV